MPRIPPPSVWEKINTAVNCIYRFILDVPRLSRLHSFHTFGIFRFLLSGSKVSRRRIAVLTMDDSESALEAPALKAAGVVDAITTHNSCVSINLSRKHPVMKTTTQKYEKT